MNKIRGTGDFSICFTCFTLIDKVEVGRFPPYLLAVRYFFVILHEILTTNPRL